jgi:hypothetical protein
MEEHAEAHLELGLVHLRVGLVRSSTAKGLNELVERQVSGRTWWS